MASARSSARALAAPSLKTGAALSLAALMAACATAPMPGPGPATRDPAQPRRRRHPGANPRRRDPALHGWPPDCARWPASPLLACARRTRPRSTTPPNSRCSITADQNTLLIPRDAGSTEASAAAAARALVADGADIIVGPVLREGVAGAAQRGAQRQYSGDRVLFRPHHRRQRRLFAELPARRRNRPHGRVTPRAAHLRSIALLAPSNEYGRRVEQTLPRRGAGARRQHSACRSSTTAPTRRRPPPRAALAAVAQRHASASHPDRR